VPAATLGQLATRLSTYTTPDGPTFPDALSQVLERVYNLGLWQDITDERVLQAQSDGTIALPLDTDAVLHWIVNDSPGGPVRPLWHDYRLIGRSANQPIGAGLIDAGFSVGASYENDEEGNYSLRFETENGTNFAGTESFTIDYTDGDGVRAAETITPDDSAAYVTSTETDIAKIHSLIWSGASKRIRVELKNTDTEFNDDNFGLISVPEGVMRHRRFRVSGARENDDVRVLLKRKPPVLANDNDIVYIGNANALKHGLLAVIAEDNADLERAQYHWTECVRIFNEELGLLDVGHQFAVNLDLTGHGGYPIQTIQ
jgi:hypothetical protein